jgi:hypothetical protein
MGFTKSEVDPDLYLIQVGEDPLILVLYVGDLFLTRAKKLISSRKRDLVLKFKMNDIGLMHYFLGLEVWLQPSEIFLREGKYAVEILRRFGMMDCKSMTTPMITNLKNLGVSNSYLVDSTLYRKLICSLMYLVNIKSDIFFVVNTLSHFIVELRQVHWVVVKHVLRYLRGTIVFFLRHVEGDGVGLHGYSYSDWAGIAIDRKRAYGGCFILGSIVLCWFSRKHTFVALSLAKQSIWQLIFLVVRLFGFAIFLQGYLVRCWGLM